MDVYLITCLVNKKIYIGKNKNSDPNYYGSGTLIKRAIKKYGKESFTKEIISDKAEDKLTLDYLEKFFIKCFESTNIEIGYNILSGGDGGRIIELLPNKAEIYKKRAKSLSKTWNAIDKTSWGEAISTGLSKSGNVKRGETISKVKNYKFIDKYVDPNKAPANCKRVSINGKIYRSASLASRELKLSYSTVRNRIKSMSFPDWNTYSEIM